ncbi:MAG: HTTM domain-containing protein [Nevskiales bacterium]
MERFRAWLAAPVDPASLAIFRISFGLLLLWDVFRYFLAGWIERYYLTPPFLFKYYGFEWVQPWPGTGLFWHFGLLGLLSVMISIGLYYRLAMLAFTLAFSYIYLLDQARYLNHFYLVIVIAMLMCLLPAARAYSIDARLRGSWRGDASIPRWSVASMVLLFEVVLIYAGLVKINADWLGGQPLRLWFSNRGQAPIIGPYIAGDWAVYAASWGSIALHLIGAPLLLWRRTRLVVFSLYACFHITNAVVFHIGIFPWLTLAGTLLFFAADWPKQLWAKLRRQGYNAAALPSPAIGPPSTLLLVLLFSFLAWQVLMPLRHYLYPGNVAWTEEGHRFAWRMKLRTKRGHARYVVTDPLSGRIWQVDPGDYLSARQERYASTRPDMILQFAKELERIWREEKGYANVEVRARVWCALNGRQPALLIDPKVDLTQVKRELWPAADWILPMPQS